jgi:hypothetical protein
VSIASNETESRCVALLIKRRSEASNLLKLDQDMKIFIGVLVDSENLKGE